MVQVSIPVSKPAVLYEKKEPQQVAAVQTQVAETVTRADDFDDGKETKLTQITEMADQANSADQFADAGHDNDDDEDDEEDEPVESSHVQTKSVTDADNYKVFKYRLEHEPQNVANKI